MATGWLGWSPRDAWETPVPEILMAWDAKLEFLKATNPFGQPEEKKIDRKALARDMRIGIRVAAATRKDAA